MAQYVKGLVTKCEDSWTGLKRELISPSYPLTSTCALRHACAVGSYILVFNIHVSDSAGDRREKTNMRIGVPY